MRSALRGHYCFMLALTLSIELELKRPINLLITDKGHLEAKHEVFSGYAIILKDWIMFQLLISIKYPTAFLSLGSFGYADGSIVPVQHRSVPFLIFFAKRQGPLLKLTLNHGGI